MTDQTRNIPKGWKMTTLGEVAEIVMEQSPRSESYNQKNDGLPFYQGITEFGDKYVRIKTFTNDPTKIIEANSILFSVRAPVGKVNFTKHRACIGRGNAGLRMKNGQQDFLYFLLKKSEKEFLGNTTGTVFDSISSEQLRNFEILIPENEGEQRAIAAVLSAFDDKIELLREQNKTLEATAQAIFKEWFVRFNFPDKDGKPYKASGGKMIDSELGEIPEGWRIFALSELVGIVNGYSYKGSELKEKGHQALVTLKSFDRNGGFQIRGFKPFDGNPKTEQEVSLGDLVIAHTDLTQDAEVLGNPAFIFDNGGYKKMYITMDLVKICSKNANIALDFYYYLMSTSSFKKHCIGYSNGTTVLHLSKRAIPEYKIALSDDLSIVMEFSKIAQATTKKLINNFSQIQTLSKLRDSLLPKLMKGEVRVNGFKN